MEGARSRDFFGLSQGKRDDKYPAFSFGQTVMIHLELNLRIFSLSHKPLFGPEKSAFSTLAITPGSRKNHFFPSAMRC
jgi:hypothetical protein